MLTRRDLLAAFLGAPFAAAACGKRAPAPVALPPGEIVGGSDRIGHRLRLDAPLSEPSSWERHDVVIVGSGIAGLAAAWHLERAGIRDVVTLELEPVAGGTARSGESRVTRFPWGAHYVPLPSAEDVVLRRLLTEMGVLVDGNVAEEHLVHDPEERIWFRGRWYEGLYPYAGASADDLAQLGKFDAEIARWAAWRDAKGRRAFAIPSALCSDDAEVTSLDRISMAAWMDARGLTSPRLRWFVEYGCRDDYGLLLHDTSAWAALFYFASRIDAPGEESRSFVTWPEGNGRIVAHLARSANVRTGWLVTDIRPTSDGVDVVALRGDQPLGIHARRVIFAGPQFVAARTIAPWRERPPGHLAEFTYGSWMVANVALRERPADSGFPLAWDNVIYDSPALGYVVATHQTGIHHGPTVLTYYYALCDSDPRIARQRLLSTARDEWAEVVLADLSRAHGEIRTLAERIDVMRWGHAMVRPRPGFIWSGALQRAAAPFRGIHFANTDLSGVALIEESLHHAVRAADEVAVALAGHAGA